MVSIDTVLAASHPYLACPQRAETMADGLGWLLYAPRMLGGTKAAMGRRRLPWLRSNTSTFSLSLLVLHGSHVPYHKYMLPQRKVYIVDLQYPQLPNPCYVDISIYLYSPFVQHMSLNSPSLTLAYIQNQWSPTAIKNHLSGMDTR